MGLVLEDPGQESWLVNLKYFWESSEETEDKWYDMNHWNEIRGIIII